MSVQGFHRWKHGNLFSSDECCFSAIVTRTSGAHKTLRHSPTRGGGCPPFVNRLSQCPPEFAKSGPTGGPFTSELSNHYTYCFGSAASVGYPFLFKRSKFKFQPASYRFLRTWYGRSCSVTFYGCTTTRPYRVEACARLSRLTHAPAATGS